MPRIYDASHLTTRRQERAIAGSFLSPRSLALPNVMRGAPPLYGMSESSVMNYVKTGSMTEYTQFPTCYNINPGCPCPQVNASVTGPIDNSHIAIPTIIIPGPVINITTSMGSIIVSWSVPSTGTGPFTYHITPYKNGVQQTSVETTATSYRFVDIEEGEPYTFDICAMNSAGMGPVAQPDKYVIAPPKVLSDIMAGTPTNSDIMNSVKYILNEGLNRVLDYAAAKNTGPTIGSHMMYLWTTSVVHSWNWVNHDRIVTGIHDNLDWDAVSSTTLSDNEKVTWLCNTIEYITPIITGITPSTSFYNCSPSLLAAVKDRADWASWLNIWNTWYNSHVMDPGFITATTTQPINSENWNKTIVVEQPTTDITNSIWTPLTILGEKQKYLSYNWGDVRSSCLSTIDDTTVQITLETGSSFKPKTGDERKSEIDDIITITSTLTDEQKCMAEMWAGGPGTVSPPLMFIWLWKQYVKYTPDIVNPLTNTLYRLTLSDIMYSLLDLSIHLFEGSRFIWLLKRKYMEARPIQEIRRIYGDTPIQSWNGIVPGNKWVPYQMNNFVTPPFADFPSGHSYFSKAFALTMNKWFGSSIIHNPVFNDRLTLISPLFTQNTSGYFGYFDIAQGSSEIQHGNVPSNKLSIIFDKWDDMADSVGMSRLYGGIHCITAHNGSVKVAELLHDIINGSWNISSPIAPVTPVVPTIRYAKQDEVVIIPEGANIEQEETDTKSEVIPEATTVIPQATDVITEAIAVIPEAIPGEAKTEVYWTEDIFQLFSDTAPVNEIIYNDI